MTDPISPDGLLQTLQDILLRGAPGPLAAAPGMVPSPLQRMVTPAPDQDATLPAWADAVGPTALALQQLLLDLTEQMVTGLAEAIEARDPFTGGHCKRLAGHCEAAARYLGLPTASQHKLRLAAYMHDVGKISVPDAILMKPGPLTTEEYTEMQRHPVLGATLLRRMPLLANIAPIVAAHHERYDGTGYPAQLTGDAIPMEARILSVADCFDALTQDRPYRKALSLDHAVAELRQGRGTQFDPLALDAFLATVEDLPARPTLKAG